MPKPARKEPTTPLSARQLRFVDEYLKDLNGTQAAIRAGYSVNGAATKASALLRQSRMSTAIHAAMRARSERTEITPDRVLLELGRVAFVDIRGFFDLTGDVKPMQDLTADQGAALAGFEVLIKNAKAGDDVTDTIHKFKLSDKTRALELLCRHLGILNDKLDLNARLKRVDETAPDAVLVAELETALGQLKAELAKRSAP